MAKTTKKAAALTAWRALEAGKNPLPLMRPIPAKTEGSRYGCCGIRIDGDPAFIDAVLSNLKPLLDGENTITRLELARHTVQPSPGYKAGINAGEGAEVCYVRLHARTTQGSAMSACFDRHLHEPSIRYAESLGVDCSEERAALLARV